MSGATDPDSNVFSQTGPLGNFREIARVDKCAEFDTGELFFKFILRVEGFYVITWFGNSNVHNAITHDEETWSLQCTRCLRNLGGGGGGGGEL